MMHALGNKTKELNAFLQINEIDIGFCVESWIRDNSDDNYLLQQCCPPVLSFAVHPASIKVLEDFIYSSFQAFS